MRALFGQRGGSGGFWSRFQTPARTACVVRSASWDGGGSGVREAAFPETTTLPGGADTEGDACAAAGSGSLAGSGSSGAVNAGVAADRAASRPSSPGSYQRWLRPSGRLRVRASGGRRRGSSGFSRQRRVRALPRLVAGPGSGRRARTPGLPRWRLAGAVRGWPGLWGSVGLGGPGRLVGLGLGLRGIVRRGRPGLLRDSGLGGLGLLALGKPRAAPRRRALRHRRSGQTTRAQRARAPGCGASASSAGAADHDCSAGARLLGRLELGNRLVGLGLGECRGGERTGGRPTTRNQGLVGPGGQDRLAGRRLLSRLELGNGSVGLGLGEDTGGERTGGRPGSVSWSLGLLGCGRPLAPRLELGLGLSGPAASAARSRGMPGLCSGRC